MRYLIPVCLMLTLSACQTQSILTDSTEPAPNCLLPGDLLAQLIEEQQQYVTSTEEERRAMLAAVEDHPARRINLLSSPDNDRAANQAAIDAYRQLPLLPSMSCSSDRYLYLRLRQAQSQLQLLDQATQLRRQLETAETRLQEQQRLISSQRDKINALTQLEQAITRQREEQ